MVWAEFNPMGWDALWGLRKLQRDMNHLIEGAETESGVYPAVNIWSSNEDVTVTAELPGFDPEKIHITVVGDQLKLEGERKENDPADGVVCHRAERGAGKFVRTFRLPFAVDDNKVKASMKSGVLTIVLPRSEVSRPRKIAIATG